MGQPQSIEERFWSKVEKTEACWNWVGATSRRGYGAMNIDNRTLQTHRVVYELTYGTIPAGLCVCHHCDNPRCVRPDHLFLGTHADNMHDMVRKGRQRQRTHKQVAPKQKRERAVRAAPVIREPKAPKIHKPRAPKQERIKTGPHDQRGENNNRAKLTALQVDEIRQAIATKTHNMYQLARIYGVHRDHIKNIIRRKKWQTTGL